MTGGWPLAASVHRCCTRIAGGRNGGLVRATTPSPQGARHRQTVHAQKIEAQRKTSRQTCGTRSAPSPGTAGRPGPATPPQTGSCPWAPALRSPWAESRACRRSQTRGQERKKKRSPPRRRQHGTRQAADGQASRPGTLHWRNVPKLELVVLVLVGVLDAGHGVRHGSGVRRKELFGTKVRELTPKSAQSYSALPLYFDFADAHNPTLTRSLVE